MKIARRIAILAAVVGLLAAAFLLSSILLAPGWALEVSREIDTFELADRSFRSDLLGARIGMLRDYDMLNHASADQRLAILALQNQAVRDGALGRKVAGLATMVKQREADVEKFKSSNVLVYNSLARFSALSVTSPRSASLSVQMLRLTLDTDPLVAREAQAKITDLIRRPRGAPRPGQTTLSAQVVTHARLLVREIPETNALLVRIMAFPVDRQVEGIRQLAAEQKNREDMARRRTAFEGAVTFGAFVVFMLSTRLRLALRSGALRRKIEVEHIGGTVSALLMDARSDDLPDRIERGLAALGAYMDADCAFLVLRDDQDRVLSWSRAVAFSADLASGLADAAALEPWDGDRLRVTADHSTVSESFALQIAKAGLQSLKLV